MATASLIGFGLVIVLVSMLFSMLFAVTLRIFARHLHSSGPFAERRAAMLALALPPLAGLLVSVTIGISKFVVYVTGNDHCVEHGHHLHLCPIHGGYWIFEPWAVAAMTFFVTFVLIRLVQTVLGHAGARRAAGRLSRIGDPVPDFERTFIVPGDARFAFTTGVFSPIVVISRAAWNALDTSQRQAVLVHEHAHVRNGDLWKRATLGILACFGAPVVTKYILNLWEIASERAGDLAAACQVGRPSIVASAILRLTVSHSMQRASESAFFAASCHVSDRIHALFERPGHSDSAARSFFVILVLGTIVLGICSVVFVDSLHHLLETILG